MMAPLTKVASSLLWLAVTAAAQETLLVASDNDYIDSEADIPMNVSSLGPTELFVSWEFDNETTHFEVNWSALNETEEKSANTTDNFYTIKDLKACTTYTVYVVAFNDSEVLGSSNDQNATTAESDRNVSSVAVDAVVDQPSQLDVSWLTQEEPGSCSNYFNVTWGRLDDTQVEKDSTAETNYTIENLQAFTNYNVCVSTVFSDTDGKLKCDVNQTVEGTPGWPLNVKAWPVGSDSLQVSWEEPDKANGILIGYTVVVTSITSEPSEHQVDGKTTTTTVSSLLPCTAYNVSVSASTAAGSGPEGSPAWATTDPAAPAAPTSINVDDVDGHPDALTVTWIQAKTSGNCSVTTNTVEWRLADTGNLIGSETSPAAVEANITGLNTSTVYCVSVAAAVDNVSGQFAECVNKTTSDHHASGNPKRPWVVAVSVIVPVIILVAAGISIYVFRDKLQRLKPRLRVPSSFGSPSRQGPGSPSSLNVNATAGEVQITDLRGYIKCLEEDTLRGLEEEFDLLKQRSPKHETVAADEVHNKSKNRFRNILPFDHSRVTLPVLAGDSSSDYINANYIKDARGRQMFVACQGPLASTVGDFWRMVWHVGAPTVVMLTNVRERGRERCALYWPIPEEPSLMGGDVAVSMRGEAGTTDLRVREFLLQKGPEQRCVRQYHYTSWPDFGVPNHEYYLLDLVSEVRDATPQNCPVVVHCSAGVGRTGTFIGMWNLMDTLDAGPSESLNVQETVLTMRECRPSMVQSPEQYMYLYKCIAVYLEQPTKWRRKEQAKDYVFSFDNPTFMKEEGNSDS